MAVYRNIQTTFWMDAKVADEFTPEDKYFYLYLFTNPHTNLCGCYEISKKQVALETGYSVDTIDRLIDRFQTVHKVISFDKSTREILLLNWHKYNWTKSDKFRMPLRKEIEKCACLWCPKERPVRVIEITPKTKEDIEWMVYRYETEHSSGQ